MKRRVNCKMMNLIWDVILIVLLVVYLFRLFLPADVGETAPSAMTWTSSGDILVVTPNKTLVQISHDGGVVPYILRQTVMKNVKAVFSYGGANMAIDLEGRLWGWQSSFAHSVLSQTLADKPTQLLEGVREVTVGSNNFAMVISEDNKLLILDNRGNCVPHMEEYSIKACRSVGSSFYVITSGGELYRFGSEMDLRFDRIGSPIADRVVDVNVAEGMTAQCLMENGAVRLLSDELTLSEPTYEGARALCTGGIINQNDELLVWMAGAQNSDAIILQPKDIGIAVASSGTLYLKSNGRMHWDGIGLPVSMNTLSPISRNLLCGWVAVKICLRWGKRRESMNRQHICCWR